VRNSISIVIAAAALGVSLLNAWLTLLRPVDCG
jgi:hypothetical protein